MLDITLTYKFWFFKIKGSGKHPEKFSELNQKQLNAVFDFFDKKLSENKLISTILKINRFLVKRLDAYHRLRLSEFLSNSLDIDKPCSSFIINQLKLKGKVFLSPGDALKGVSFGRFVFIETYFLLFEKDKDDEAFNKFLAALYVEQDKVFTEKTVDNFRYFKKLSPSTKSAIYYNYKLLRNWLRTKYTWIYQSWDDKEEAKKYDVKDVNVKVWLSFRDNIIGDDIINEDKYDQLPAGNVLSYINRKIKLNNMKN
jgi:hypothetical protein